jgi:hypothetical protein
VAFAISGYGYIGVGAYAGTLYSDFYEYNPEADSWTQKADYPGNGQDACSGFGLKDRGYIGGGSNQQTWFSDFWEWEQATDVWTALEDFPGSPRAFGTGLEILNKGYMGMGESSSYYHDWWEYTPDTTIGTSIVSADENNSFDFPNLLVNESIVIRYEIQHPSQLLIRNMNGTTVYSCSLPKAQQTVTIPSTDFETGIYFYEVRNYSGIIAAGQVVMLR